MSRLWHGALVAAVALVAAFVALPLAALLAQTSARELLEGARSPAATDALVVTLRTNAIAQALVLAVGTPAAYALATRRFRGRAALVTLLELPLVLPPAVAGIALLAAWGRHGTAGEPLGRLGVSAGVGTQAAVVLAVAFVAGPLYVRQAIASFEAVDTGLVEAARTLGAGPARVFGRIAVPLAAGGLATGAALSVARGIGEFGATIMFAGSLQGVTQTLPLAVYRELGAGREAALAIGVELLAVSAAILAAVKLVSAWTRSRSTSASPVAPAST